MFNRRANKTLRHSIANSVLEQSKVSGCSRTKLSVENKDKREKKGEIKEQSPANIT